MCQKAICCLTDEDYRTDLAIIQATQRLEQQRQFVTHIRTQAAALGTFSLLVFSYTGPQAEHFETTLELLLLYFGMIAFLGSLWFALLAAIARPVWHFSLHEDQVREVARLQTKGLAFEGRCRAVSEELFKFVEHNQYEIDSINLRLTWGICAATLQIILWLLMVGL